MVPVLQGCGCLAGKQPEGRAGLPSPRLLPSTHPPHRPLTNSGPPPSAPLPHLDASCPRCLQVEVRRSGRLQGDQPEYNEDNMAAMQLGIDRWAQWGWAGGWVGGFPKANLYVGRDGKGGAWLVRSGECVSHHRHLTAAPAAPPPPPPLPWPPLQPLPRPPPLPPLRPPEPPPLPPTSRLDLIARPRRRRVGINPTDLQSIRERRMR